MNISNFVIFGILETVDLYCFTHKSHYRMSGLSLIHFSACAPTHTSFSANNAPDRMEITLGNNVLFNIIFRKFQRMHVIFARVSCAYVHLYASDRSCSRFGDRLGMYFIPTYYIKITKMLYVIHFV